MTSEQRRPCAIYAITQHGVKIAARLAEVLPGATVFASDRVRGGLPSAEHLPLPMGPTLEQEFRKFDCHIFVISVGAVVRMIAPVLVNKKVDPAVVCVDDAAKFAVCVLSGHVGRGNEYTDRVARALDAASVVTTASDVTGTLTVDILGRELGWVLDDLDRNVTLGCAAVVNAEPVAFVQEAGGENWWPIDKELPKGVSLWRSLDEVVPSEHEMLLVATDRAVEVTYPQHFAKAVIYRPKTLVLGVGCDRGTPLELVRRGVLQVLASHGLSVKSVAALASVDVKADEPALLALAAEFGWPFRTFSSAELDQVTEIATPSAVVKKHVGTRSVSEAAALLCAKEQALIQTRCADNAPLPDVTLHVPKQIYKESGVDCAMTLAVARLGFPLQRPSSQRKPGEPTVAVASEVAP